MTVWDEIRGKIVLVVSVSSVPAGPVYIFDRETRRNGSDIGPCDVQISRSPGGGRKFNKVIPFPQDGERVLFWRGDY